MRTKTELLLLMKETIARFNKDFPGTESIRLIPAIENALNKKIEKFVHDRLGHLAESEDLSNFCQLLSSFKEEPPIEDVTPESEPEVLPKEIADEKTKKRGGRKPSGS